MRILAIVAAGILCFLNSTARAEPLSKILKSVEQKKIRPVKATLENRQWVIDGIDGKESVRLHVNSNSGGIVKREVIPDLDPIESSLPMSRVIRKMEEADPGPLYRVHFAKHRWVVETKRGKLVTEVELSADTGELLLGKDEK